MTLGEFRKVKKFITEWEDRREVVTYQIVETFGSNVDTYEVLNLLIDTEDGVIYFSDVNNIILDKPRCITKGFILSSAELVEFYKDQFSIRLKDGVIKIKVIG